MCWDRFIELPTGNHGHCLSHLVSDFGLIIASSVDAMIFGKRRWYDTDRFDNILLDARSIITYRRYESTPQWLKWRCWLQSRTIWDLGKKSFDNDEEFSEHENVLLTQHYVLYLCTLSTQKFVCHYFANAQIRGRCPLPRAFNTSSSLLFATSKL